MEKIIGLIVFVSLLIFGIHFFHIDKFKAGHFITFTAIIIISGLAFYGFDRLKEFDIRNMRIVLNEMKETKKDIEKEVILLLETLALSNISSALETGRFANKDLQYEMIKKRERAKELFKKAGWDDQKIKSEIEKINIYIVGDIASTIKSEANKSLAGKKSKDGKPLNLRFQEKFPKLRDKAKLSKDMIVEVKDYLKKYQIPLEQFELLFQNMEYFIETGQLKRPIGE